VNVHAVNCLVRRSWCSHQVTAANGSRTAPELKPKAVRTQQDFWTGWLHTSTGAVRSSVPDEGQFLEGLAVKGLVTFGHVADRPGSDRIPRRQDDFPRDTRSTTPLQPSDSSNCLASVNSRFPSPTPWNSGLQIEFVDFAFLRQRAGAVEAQAWRNRPPCRRHRAPGSMWSRASARLPPADIAALQHVAQGLVAAGSRNRHGSRPLDGSSAMASASCGFGMPVCRSLTCSCASIHTTAHGMSAQKVIKPGLPRLLPTALFCGRHRGELTVC
jgi:hypothetical protein